MKSTYTPSLQSMEEQRMIQKKLGKWIIVCIVLCILAIPLCIWLTYAENNNPDNIVYDTTIINQIEKNYKRDGYSKYSMDFSHYRLFLDNGTTCAYYYEFDEQTERLFYHAQKSKVPVYLATNNGKLHYLEIEGEILVSPEIIEANEAKKESTRRSSSFVTLGFGISMLIILFLYFLKNKKEHNKNMGKIK